MPIMITGDSGEVVELNRAWQDITAYTMDEVRTMASWSSLTSNEEDAALLEAAISGFRKEGSKRTKGLGRKKQGESPLPKAAVSAQLEPTDSY
jgi:PAS domain S-box-containing protein